MFFLKHSKKCFFKFLTQIDYRIRNKMFRNAKNTIIMIFRLESEKK